MAPDRGSSNSKRSNIDYGGDSARSGLLPRSRSRSRSQSPIEATSHSHTSPNDDNHHTNDNDIRQTLSRTRSDMGLYAVRSHRSAKDGTTSDAAEQEKEDALLIDRTSFTLRGVLVGLGIGTIIAFSNTYFGLQTGWVSGMAMPASLIGFAVFKTVSRHLVLPFTPVENVLVQTVAGAVGTMPLGLGYVGVMPSLQFLLKKDEGAPIDLSLWRLIVWGIGLCMFGVVFGVPLRRQVIVKEKLKFPSGTATALTISVLHGGGGAGNGDEKGGRKSRDVGDTGEIVTEGTLERERLLNGSGPDNDESDGNQHVRASEEMDKDDKTKADWKKQIRLLLIAFGVSGFYTLLKYFIPILSKLPIFGTYIATTWVWTLNPSPAYVGQGIIMGAATTLHMLLGAIVGWAVLSPIAKNNGWAPGDVDDWETGSKGWIVWVSLAIMLADAIINLGWLVLRPVIRRGPTLLKRSVQHYRHTKDWRDFLLPGHSSDRSGRDNNKVVKPGHYDDNDDIPEDAPPHHLVSGQTLAILLIVTVVVCIICIHISFGQYIPISLNILSLVLALLLSIMGVRALGETDLNPVSGISKLTQLVFALVTPNNKNAVIINLLAGAVSESGALQAGDMLQDLKAGHLIGASPKAQFYGQMIGSVFGAFVSALVYKLYVSVYKIPSDLFEIPTAFVWIFTARLVTGDGLPRMAGQFAVAAGILFVILTALRIYLLASPEGNWKRRLHPWIPGGIAVAVGMYNTPSFTLARTVGGLISLWYVTWKGRSETTVIVLASGLILGEGVVSIISLILASANVPHL